MPTPRPPRRTWRALLLMAALGAAVVAGCGDDTTASDDQLAVVATTTQIADITRAVGGDDVHVTQLLKANTDPHDYEPRPDDVKAAARAKVIFASGLGLDGWADEVAEQSRGKAKPIHIGDDLPIEREGEEHDDHGDEEEHAGEAEEEHADEEEHVVDPHWWHDPRNVGTATQRIRDALIDADPDNADTYRKNAAAYESKVAALDDGIARCIASVPEDQRKLVTDHDAFGYFTDRYDIHVVGAVIPSQTTQAQPNAGDLAELADLVKREKVKAIFPESSLSPKLVQALADQTGITSEYTLYGDSLGPEGSDGATYLSMERANADAMVRGFTGGARGCEIDGIA